MPTRVPRHLGAGWGEAVGMLPSPPPCVPGRMTLDENEGCLQEVLGCLRDSGDLTCAGDTAMTGVGSVLRHGSGFLS